MTAVTVCYFEIPAPNLEAAETFYANVFDWTIRRSDLSDQPYSMCQTGDPLGGGLRPDLPIGDGGVIVYFKVKDIPTTLAAIEDAGGSTLVPKEDIGGDYGFSAEFRDPNGNRMGLWSRT